MTLSAKINLFHTKKQASKKRDDANVQDDEAEIELFQTVDYDPYSKS